MEELALVLFLFHHRRSVTVLGHTKRTGADILQPLIAYVLIVPLRHLVAWRCVQPAPTFDTATSADETAGLPGAMQQIRERTPGRRLDMHHPTDRIARFPW